jgi:hypothetical protein
VVACLHAELMKRQSEEVNQGKSYQRVYVTSDGGYRIESSDEPLRIRWLRVSSITPRRELSDIAGDLACQSLRLLGHYCDRD